MLAEAVQILTATPAVVRSLLSGLSDGWLEANEGPGTWSPRQVVAHLADLEQQDWTIRTRIIMEHGETRPFSPVDRERFRRTLAGWSTAQLVDLFAERRAQNLDSLKPLALTPTDLARKGSHPALGSVILQQLLAAWVVHDFTHIGQMVRVMASRYRDAVGPWRAYLGILSWRREA